MAARRKHARRRPPGIRLRRVPGTQENVWELVHPACVGERTEDLEEVRLMLAAGEDEVARDELLWLLGDCREFVEAHKLLGEIAARGGDTGLARGHFGQAYELVVKALPGAFRGRLPFDRPANRPFLEAAKGLALAAHEQGRDDLAVPVARRLLAFDPSDPLEIEPLLGRWRDA